MLVAQSGLGLLYPVGVVTGVLGALAHRPQQQRGRLTGTTAHTLTAEGVTLGYGDRTVVDGLSTDPTSGTPLMLPLGRRRPAAARIDSVNGAEMTDV
ncbi:hypothetical protein [Rathayibacter rathayi]|uniref:hypothetical protein n=1 Tax=Rathayibacter rathayi TaxID=33887 RepID=UPI0030B89E9D